MVNKHKTYVCTLYDDDGKRFSQRVSLEIGYGCAPLYALFEKERAYYFAHVGMSVCPSVCFRSIT